MIQLAKLRGDKSAIKMEKIRRRTVGHVKTPPRPPSGRATRARRARASTSRPAAEPQPELEPAPEEVQPQAEAVEAPAPVTTPSEEQADAKPENEEEVRPLEKARALCLERRKAEREKAEREKENLDKEEAAPAAKDQDQPPTTAVPGESEEVSFNPEDLKPKHKQTIRRELWPDDWRVGLLSPDPNNPRPVFSPPPKPSDKPAKEDEIELPVVPVSEAEEVECAPVVEEPEQGEDSDTNTELAEEEVFELTSIGDIRVPLPDHDAGLEKVNEHDKTMRENKRKAEDEEDEEEGNAERAIAALEQSPKKRRRTGLRGWLSKVF
uniref:Rim9 protein n=1 Tax=Ganoderma boninense TaxID=34458 RepID=A0A5K1K036_9APHY|nr:Rim9 protein [Ganoderma boninense]